MKHENGKDHVYNVFKAWQRLRKEHGAGHPLLRLEVFEEVAIFNSIRSRPRLYLFLPHTVFSTGCPNQTGPKENLHTISRKATEYV